MSPLRPEGLRSPREAAQATAEQGSRQLAGANLREAGEAGKSWFISALRPHEEVLGDPVNPLHLRPRIQPERPSCFTNRA